MGVDFPRTMWATLSRAKAGSRVALNEVFSSYRPAIVEFIRARGLQESDAEDVAHSVFEILLSEKVLAKADRSKGRFRSLLLGVTKHVLSRRARKDHAKKRGGRARILSLDQDADADDEFPLADIVAAGSEHEEEFDQAWAKNILRIAFDRLEQEHGQRGKTEGAIIRAFLAEGESHREIADSLGMTEVAVRSVVHRTRKRLQELVVQAIREYCSSADEYKDEVSRVVRLIASPK